MIILGATYWLLNVLLPFAWVFIAEPREAVLLCFFYVAAAFVAEDTWEDDKLYCIPIGTFLDLVL